MCSFYSSVESFVSALEANGGSEELNTLLAKAREEGRKEAVPEGWQVVPKEPTDEQWDGLARDIIFWHDTDAKRTGSGLLEFLERIGQDIPQWLRDEPEVANGNYLSKGTRAVIVYRAMLADAPSPASLNAKEGG